jgi:hypothetical protein
MKIQNVLLCLLVLAVPAVCSAQTTTPYYGPHQGTIAGSVDGSYISASGNGVSGQLGEIGFDLDYYATDQIFVRGELGYDWLSGKYNSSNGSSNATSYGALLGYDFTSTSNIIPYVAAGFEGATSGAGVGGVGIGISDKSFTTFAAAVGVDDYFAKGRAIFLEEDYLQDSGTTLYTTALGLRLDLN